MKLPYSFLTSQCLVGASPPPETRRKSATKVAGRTDKQEEKDKGKKRKLKEEIAWRTSRKEKLTHSRRRPPWFPPETMKN